MKTDRELIDFEKKLICQFRVISGTKTALYFSSNFSSKQQSERPILLFVHGINGSHFGLVPLAKYHSEHHNVRFILVDLPGHGASSTPSWHDIPNLQEWFTGLIENLTNHAEVPSKIIAHSFGCYAITSTKIRLLYISPVPEITKLYGRLTKLLIKPFRSRVFTKFYDWTAFSAWRGDLMLKKKSKANKRIQWFVAYGDSTASPEQREFQILLASSSIGTKLFANYKPNIVVYGRYDELTKRFSRAQMQRIFPDADVKVIDSKHLPTTEKIDELSDIIGKL